MNFIHFEQKYKAKYPVYRSQICNGKTLRYFDVGTRNLFSLYLKIS